MDCLDEMQQAYGKLKKKKLMEVNVFNTIRSFWINLQEEFWLSFEFEL